MTFRRFSYIEKICKDPVNGGFPISILIPILCILFLIQVGLLNLGLYAILYAILAIILMPLTLSTCLFGWLRIDGYISDNRIKHDIRYAAFKACLDASEKHNEVIARWNSMVPYLNASGSKDPEIQQIQEGVEVCRNTIEYMLNEWKSETDNCPLGNHIATSNTPLEVQSKMTDVFFDQLNRVAHDVAHLESYLPSVTVGATT